jgi:Virulence-associated protein E
MLAPIDNNSLRFLELVLPNGGHYIAALKRPAGKGFARSVFALTLQDLWNTIEAADRDGFETYHACASFKEALNDPQGTPDGQKRLGRTKQNIFGARAFWLDIDCGVNKPYLDQDKAGDALAAFCQALKLPRPVVVTSGAGLHVYWPLVEALDRETWEKYAKGLKVLCVKHALQVDHARTADISSVLRTPGTHNRKSGKPLEVKCDPRCLEQPSAPLDRFAIFLEAAPQAVTCVEGKPPSQVRGIPALAGPVPEHIANRRRTSMLSDAIGGIVVRVPAYGAQIANRCAQLRVLRDNMGRVPEPHWYAALGVLAFCEDGKALGHDWSSGYEGYSFEETQDRLNRAADLRGPTTCAHFQSINPSGCEGCSHRGVMKSPIVLGRQPAMSPKIVGRGDVVGEIASLPAWDLTKDGALKAKSYINAAKALAELGIKCRHDIFHDLKIVEGDAVGNYGPELSDPLCRAVRDLIIQRYKSDPGIDNVQQALERACEANQFDPVQDYLSSLLWDGTPRLDRWLSTYMGADDNNLNRAQGRLVLVAAVRRARRPGAKFDQIMVFEGPEGTGKSSAIALLAGEGNFSDQTILNVDDNKQMELLRGVWLYECSELGGISKSEVDHVKAFASRTEDRGRPAYARHVVKRPRRCVIFATTNNDRYLKSQTGDRRFWPVRTGRVDLDLLRRDRDQLFAEAAHFEAQSVSLMLPSHLWGVARIEQEKRQEADPWEDALVSVKGEVCPATDPASPDGQEERIATQQLLCGFLQLEIGRTTDRDAKRLSYCMRRLGWSGPKPMRLGGKTTKGYWRPVTLHPK